MPFYSCIPPLHMDGLRLDPCNPSEFPFLGGLSSNPHPLEFPIIFTFLQHLEIIDWLLLKITHIFGCNFLLWVIHFLGLKGNISNLQCVNLMEHASLTSFQRELHKDHKQLVNLKTPRNTYTLQVSFIHRRLLNMSTKHNQQSNFMGNF